jgi:hypothetical protein
VAYRTELKGISINGHYMVGSHVFDRILFDSGSTFTYLPQKLFKMFLDHFDMFCLADPDNHCLGKRIHKGGDTKTICF